MPDFEDERGWITDLVTGPDYAVTQIFTKEGSVRGNHYHKKTTQTVHVLYGQLLCRSGAMGEFVGYAISASDRILDAGQSVTEFAEQTHAWRALKDTLVVVITRGPRSGKNYESDTFRLETPLL